jgi:hypothetical protein
MAEPGSKIAESDKRPVVEDLLLKGMPTKRISRYLREMYGLNFSEKTIADFRDNFFRSENGVVNQLIQASRDLVDNDPPATSDRELLSQYFSFKQTHGDLGLIYERVRKLKEFADKMPFDESYDKRISMLLTTAEAIRTRVYKHQYEQMRKGILLNVGKKIVMAAINVFLPYIPSDKRKDAVTKFEAIIKPMLGMSSTPDEPEDIIDIKEEMDIASSEPAPPAPDLGDIDMGMGESDAPAA